MTTRRELKGRLRDLTARVRATTSMEELDDIMRQTKALREAIKYYKPDPGRKQRMAADERKRKHKAQRDARRRAR